MTRYLGEGLTPQQAVAKTLHRLDGAFALAILFAGDDDLLIGARRGSPLAVGYGDGEMFVGSDALALAPLTRRISYLEEGDWAVLTAHGATIYDADDRTVEREVKRDRAVRRADRQGQPPPFHAEGDLRAAGGDRRHAARAVQPDDAQRRSRPSLPFDLATLTRITIVACGTSFHAGLVAKYWFEHIARVPVEVDIASEFRYRAPDMPAGGLALFISQSGETADTLAALRYCQSQKQQIAVVVNEPESTMAREADVGAADPGRPRDRRRLDQGLHDPARRARLPRHRRRAGARQHRSRRARRRCRRR